MAEDDVIDVDARMAGVDPVAKYAAVVGSHSLAYYLDKFLLFDKLGEGAPTSWNWAAFFAGPLWALYRKMYGVFAIGLIVHSITYSANQHTAAMWPSIVALAFFMAQGVWGNALYHRKVKGVLRRADALYADPAQNFLHASSFGGVNRWVPWVFGAVPLAGIVLAIALPMLDRSEPTAQYKSTPSVEQPAVALTPLPDDVKLDPKPGPVQAGTSDGRYATATGRPPDEPREAKVAYAAPRPAPQQQERPTPRRTITAEEHRDMDAIAQRAVADFPYLDTPAGAEAIAKIVQRRDELIASGVYPSLALTRAVQAFAAALEPKQHVQRSQPPAQPQPLPGQSGPCKWVSGQEWKCD